jgi:hypothetical protein
LIPKKEKGKEMEERWKALPRFLEILGYDEEPMGIFYTDQKPAEGFTPSSLDLPTREKEQNQQINWQAVFGDFSCVIGHIWRARKRDLPLIRPLRCPEALFFSVSSLRPRPLSTMFQREYWRMEEHYCDSPDVLRGYAILIGSAPSLCVVKP